MQEILIPLLRCPVTRSALSLQVISTSTKVYDGHEEKVIQNGIFYSEQDWFYPVIQGIPRLIVEAFLDYESFFREYLPDYTRKRNYLENKYGGLIKYVRRKNEHSKQSFSQEWNLFDYEKDKTWNEGPDGMYQRFLKETIETNESLAGKLILDAGCGNGLLNQGIAKKGALIIGMDFSLSILKAYERNAEKKALFIQGDIQFPPVAFEAFDIVHSSGVLICTNNTELSFSCIEPCVKQGGKLSVWLYHPRKNFIHKVFNLIRRITSKLPVKAQYYLYLVTVFPVSFLIKRLKGNHQNRREIMVGILDWLSPRYRWEHTHEEAASWFYKRRYHNVQVTTSDLFGFNITGEKEISNAGDILINTYTERNESRDF